MLDNRKVKILMQIINSSNGIKIQNIQNNLNISRRTIYYDLEIINDWLLSNNLNTIHNSRKTGLSLNINYDELQSLLGDTCENSYEPLLNNRVCFIVILIAISNIKINIKDISNYTSMSKSSTLKDISDCREVLDSFNVTLEYSRSEGYFIKGDEIAVRKSIAHCISVLFDNVYEDILIKRFEYIFLLNNSTKTFIDSLSLFKHLIEDMELSLKRKLNFQMANFLKFYFSVISLRIQNKKYIHYSVEESNEIKNTIEFATSARFKEIFEREYRVTLISDELVHFTIQLLCCSINHCYINNDSNILKSIKIDIIPLLVNKFETYACIDFNDKETLKDSLHLHFLPAYYRALYKIPLENSLKDFILKEYYDVYILTKKALSECEKLLNISFSVSEVTYFTMHFESSMKIQGININNKTIAVVCHSGLATSSFIKKQLTTLVEGECNIHIYSYREFIEKSPQVDLIVSSIHLKDYNNIVYVNSIFTLEDKKNILKKLGYKNASLYKKDISTDILDIVSKHCNIIDSEPLLQDLKNYFSDDFNLKEKEIYKPMLSELIVKDKINIISSVDNWQEAVSIAAAPLLKEDYINEDYIDAIISSTEQHGPYYIVSPRIALPHARPENGVKKLGMSLLKIKEPTCFSDKDSDLANLVIVLAAIDNNSHLKALTQLTELLSNDDDVKSILEATSVDEVLKIIEKY